jgi:hypothetical protein
MHEGEKREKARLVYLGSLLPSCHASSFLLQQTLEVVRQMDPTGKDESRVPHVPNRTTIKGPGVTAATYQKKKKKKGKNINETTQFALRTSRSIKSAMGVPIPVAMTLTPTPRNVPVYVVKPRLVDSTVV